MGTLKADGMPTQVAALPPCLRQILTIKLKYNIAFSVKAAINRKSTANNYVACHALILRFPDYRSLRPGEDSRARIALSFGCLTHSSPPTSPKK